MITCHKCGRKIEDRYKFCLSCGAPLSAHMSQPNVPAVTPAAAQSAAESAPALARVASTDARALDSVGPAVVNVAAPVISSSLRHMPPPSDEPTLPEQRAHQHHDHHHEELEAVELSLEALEDEPVLPSPRICRKCNTELPPGFIFCGRCGDRYLEQGPDFATAAHPVISANTETTTPVRGRLVLIHPDGSEGDSVALIDGENVLGSQSVGVLADSDFVSPQHCKVTCTNGTITLEDLGSVNGVYVRLGVDPVVLLHGDQIRVGQEVFRYIDWDRRIPIAQTGDDTLVQGGPSVDAWGALELVHGPRQVSNVYVLTDDEQIVGREGGQIVLRDDGFISGRHAKLRPSATGVTLQDLDSSNGTYVRLRRPYRAKDGDFFLIGQQLFLLHSRF